eukprot:5228012-Amphidinium_carterae.1
MLWRRRPQPVPLKRRSPPPCYRTGRSSQACLNSKGTDERNVLANTGRRESLRLASFVVLNRQTLLGSSVYTSAAIATQVARLGTIDCSPVLARPTYQLGCWSLST